MASSINTTSKPGRKCRKRVGLPAICQSVALVGLVAVGLLFTVYHVDLWHGGNDGVSDHMSRRLGKSSFCNAADDDSGDCGPTAHPGLVLPILMGVIYLFWAIAIICDDFFVPALETIAIRLDMSDDIAGATLMAAGGSAPELATSLIGTFTGSDVGFGTIVGSAVFNVLFVIACCVAFTPEEFAPLRLTGWPLGRDCLYYIVSLLVLFIFFGVISPAEIELWEALVLLLLYIGYCTLMYFNEALHLRLTGSSLKVCPEETPVGTPRTTYTPTAFRTGVFSLSGKGGNVFENAGMGMIYKLKGHVKEAFEALDTDKSGTLDKRELKVLLEDLFGTPGCPVKDEQVDQLISAIDLNDDGVVDLHEFTEWYIKSEKRLQYEERTTFNELDKDATGLIQLSQLPQLLIRLGVTVTAEETKDIVKDFEEKAVESNNPGTLSFENFSMWFENSAYWDKKQKTAEAVAEDSKGIWGELMEFPKDTTSANVLYIVMIPILWPLAITMGFTDVRMPENEGYSYLQFFVSIIWIGFYSFFMVDWITLIGNTLGIPAVVMGLTLLAAGTSVPDLLSSVVVAKAGKGDMAVSSSIGSNIFDVTVGLPVPWILFNLVYGCPVQVGADNLVISIIVLIGMVAAVILTIILSDWKMSKNLGGAMMVLYLVFLTQDVLRVFLTSSVKC